MGLPESGVRNVTKTTALNDFQKDLVAGHTDVVKWAIYEHIKVNENIPGLGYDDLFQEGCLWLCKAAVNYDGEKAQFKTYAQTVVKNGLRTYCTTVIRHNINAVSMDDLQEPGDDDNDGYVSVEEKCEAMLSDAAVFKLLASVKPEYNGITLLGIEALELKVKGYTGAEIARMWGVEQNLLGAWISRAKKKLLLNERFVAELHTM
jgi:RNA polymerase sigma factor (sigma-70 family)